MGPLLMECFALEVLYNQGGYHVPLALPWQDQSSVLALSDSSDLAPIVAPNLDPWEKGNPFSQENIDAGFVENEPLGIVGASAGSGQLLQRIKALLDKTDSPMTCKEIYPRMLVPLDSQTSYMEFPDWSRFLGADMFFDVCDSDQTERDVVWLASTFVVPAYGLPRKHFSVLRGVEKRFVAVTSPDLYRYRSLSDAIPGFISEMDTLHGPGGWHFICLVLQWKAGMDAPMLQQVTSDALPDPYDSRFVGFIANHGASALLPDLAAQPKDYEDFVEIWRSIVKLHGTKLGVNDITMGGLGAGRADVKVVDRSIKVAMGFRKWQWAADDPRAASDT